MKEVIRTANAPQAIGPYSQAIRVGDFLFASGQIPIDPASGEIVAGGIEEQTVRVMENIKQVLAAAGLDFSHVVKTTVFITSMADFAAVNQIYGRYFPENPPARSCVAVAELPKGARVEVEVIACARK